VILQTIFALVTLELLIVGWIDLKTEKISNKWVLANVLLAVIFHMAFPSIYPFTWEVFLFPLGMIGVGFILYLLNIMGAGDSKFLASLFLIIPTELHLLFFEKLVLSTIVTGTCLLFFRIIKQGSTLRAYLISRHYAGIKQTLRSRFSYAPVITVAWILLGLGLWI
jgi:prepilin peptidase CpaA